MSLSLSDRLVLNGMLNKLSGIAGYREDALLGNIGQDVGVVSDDYFQVVDNRGERDAIPVDERFAGMIVLVRADDFGTNVPWQLNDDLVSWALAGVGIGRLMGISGEPVGLGGQAIAFYDDSRQVFKVIDKNGYGASFGTGAGATGRIVANLAARDAIPANERMEGMLCQVITDGVNGNYVVWQLQGGVANSNWKPAWAGGGLVKAIGLASDPNLVGEAYAFYNSTRDVFSIRDKNGYVGSFGTGTGPAARICEDIATRDAIPANERKVGMLAQVLTDPVHGDYTVWQLQGGILNANWQPAWVGGGLLKATGLAADPNLVGEAYAFYDDGRQVFTAVDKNGYGASFGTGAGATARIMDTLADRDAIPAKERRTGMIVQVLQDPGPGPNQGPGRVYQLQSNLTTWFDIMLPIASLGPVFSAAPTVNNGGHPFIWSKYAPSIAAVEVHYLDPVIGLHFNVIATLESNVLKTNKIPVFGALSNSHIEASSLSISGTTLSGVQTMSLTHLTVTSDAKLSKIFVGGLAVVIALGDSFTFSPEWGSTVAHSNARGTESAFEFTVTPSGSGIAADPVITYTVSTSFALINHIPLYAVVSVFDSTDPLGTTYLAPCKTSFNGSNHVLTITMRGLPVSGMDYKFRVMLVGNTAS